MPGTAEFGLAGVGEGRERGEGARARWKTSGRPAHSRLSELVRECGLSPKGNGEPQKAVSRELAHSDGRVCVEGYGKVEAWWPVSRHEWNRALVVLQREGRLIGHQPK